MSCSETPHTMATFDDKYRAVRQKLDNLGYNQTLSIESSPLVNALVEDLCSSKAKYVWQKNMAEEATKRCKKLELSIQPLKEECNRLLNHNGFLLHNLKEAKEHNEKSLQDMRKHVNELEGLYSDLEFANMEQLTKIGALEQQILIQNEKLLKYESLPKNVLRNASGILSLKNALPPSNLKNQEIKESCNISNIRSVNHFISDILSHKTPNELSQEVEKLKSERARLSDQIEFYRTQIRSRDEEIRRLIAQPPSYNSSQYPFVTCACHIEEDGNEGDDELPNDFDDLRLDVLNGKLSRAVKHALSLAKKVTQYENYFLQKDNYACMCQDIAKLQDIFRCCKCKSNHGWSPPSETPSMRKINEILGMVDRLTCENIDLRKQIEQSKKQVVPHSCDGLVEELSCLKETCTDLTYEKLAHLREINDLRERNSALTSLIEQMTVSLQKNGKHKLRAEANGRSSSGQRKQEAGNKGSGGKTVKVSGVPSKDSVAAAIMNSNQMKKEVIKENEDTSKITVTPTGELKSEGNDALQKMTLELEQTKAERDYYSKEYQRVAMKYAGVMQTKASCSEAEGGSNRAGSTIHQIEVSSLQQKINEVNDNLKTITAELQSVKSERDYYSKAYHHLVDKFFGTMQSKANNHETEVPSVTQNHHHLQDEVISLQQKIIEHQEALQYERCQYKIEKQKFEDTVKYVEIERNNAIAKQDELLNKIQFLEGTADNLEKKTQGILTESSFLQSQSNNLRSINEHLERSLKNTEASIQRINHELNNSLQLINTLEHEKKELMAKLTYAKKETQTTNEKLLVLVKEKDHLMEKLDIQAIEINRLEKENRQQLCAVNNLEQKISRLNCQAVRSANEESRAERDITNLKNELQLRIEEISKLSAEKMALHSDLEALIKDNEEINNENENYKKEIMKLKEQLQNYVQEVRRVEQILEAKEMEREETLEQFKTITMHLESHKKSLESENKWTNNNLLIAQEKVLDLQATVQTKDSIVTEMEEQIMQLSNEVCFLKNELTSLQIENSRLQQDVETSKELTKSMDYKKPKYESESHSLGDQIEQVSLETNETHNLKEKFTSQLEKQKNMISTLENAFSSSREEAAEHYLINHSTQQKVKELEKIMAKLQAELAAVTNSLSNCQKTCDEYMNENTQLKRELANERFEKAKADETQSYSTSL